MKKLLYTFSFKNFIFNFLVILIFFYLLQLIFLKEIFKNSGFRLNKVFNGDYNDVENIILGNSRSYSLSFYSDKKKNLNFSFNEMTFQNLEQILNAIEKKSTKSNIFIEITSLLDEEYNCSYHTFILHEFFDLEILKKKCKMEYYLSTYLPFFRVNSLLFYRTVYYYFNPNKDQSFVSGDIYDKSICTNNKKGIYDFIFSKENFLDKTSKKLELIKNNFSNLKINFFVLPYHKASSNLIKDLESFLNEEYNNNELLLNQGLNQNFYNDCENFLDRIHLSKKGILKIDFIDKLSHQN